MPTWKLILGKFEELEFEIRPSLIIADPPDNLGVEYDGYDDNLPTEEYEKKLALWLRLCCERTDGPVFFTFNEMWLPAVEEAIREYRLKLVQRCWWYFTFGQSQKVRYTQSLRPLYWLNSPVVYPDAIRVLSARQAKYHDKRFKPGGKMPDNVWTFSRICGTFKERRRWHKCQLPEALVERIVLGHSRPGEWVADPFLGSGTTAIVAVRHDRNCLGIDVSGTYLENVDRILRESSTEKGAA